MVVLGILSVVAVVFGLAALVLSIILVWTIATRRDELYREKYQRFLEQQQRVSSRLDARDF
jgi:hypothetical protein